jgi:hypothetical protein
MLSQTVLPDGVTPWVHVVVNQDTINGKRMWINGILEASNSTKTTLFTAGTFAAFGWGYYSFNGWLAQGKVMNKTLTQADVDILYSTKIAIPTALQNKDFLLEGKVQPKGNAAFERIENLSGLVVAKDAASVYRAGFTSGFGFNSSDKILTRGRF